MRAGIAEVRYSNVKWRYPPGTRPWRARGDSVQLDECWIPSRESDLNITICVQKGSSRRDALQWIHHGLEMARKDIHAESLAEHINCLKPLTTRSTFFKACADYRSDSLEDLSRETGKQITCNGKVSTQEA